MKLSARHLKVSYLERKNKGKKYSSVYIRLSRGKDEYRFFTGINCITGTLNTKKGIIKNDAISSDLLVTMERNIYEGYIKVFNEKKDIDLKLLKPFAFGKEPVLDISIPNLFKCLDLYLSDNYEDSSCQKEVETVKKNSYYIKNIKSYFENQNLTSIELNDIKLIHADGLMRFIKSDRNAGQNHAIRHIQMLKRVFRYAIANEWTNRNPFENFRAKKEKKEIVFLTENEVNRLQNIILNCEVLDIARDLFLFSCYTGLAYIDLKNLEYRNIHQADEGGFSYMEVIREKSNIKSIIPLLSPAQELLAKYRNHQGQEPQKCFPVPSNQQINRLIKEVAALASIKTQPTFHIARKTCACYLYNNGIPVEVISAFLGHTSTNTTLSYYAKMHKETVIKTVMTNPNLLLNHR